MLGLIFEAVYVGTPSLILLSDPDIQRLETFRKQPNHMSSLNEKRRLVTTSLLFAIIAIQLSDALVFSFQPKGNQT